MKKSNSGSTSVIVVHDDCLHIAVSDSKNRMNRLKKISLHDFLSDSDPKTERSSKKGDYHKILMIVPSYWLGKVLYTLPSKKPSHIEAYLDRKLASEHPSLREITDYYEYYSVTGNNQQHQIYSYYLQEPSAYTVYQKIIHLGMGIPCITTPVYLCAHVVRKHQKDFLKDGKCIIHLLAANCCLYFFYQGQFVFERTFPLPATEPGVNEDEKRSIITYEISQSLYFFSQETKSTVSEFYLLTTTGESASDLSSQLDKTVHDLSEAAVNRSNIDIEKDLGPVTSFFSNDLNPSSGILTILPKTIKTDLAWRPIQLCGILCGIFLLAVLLAESVFLWNRTKPMLDVSHMSKTLHGTPRDTIHEYSDALDYLIAGKSQYSVLDIISKIAISLPDNMRIKNVSIGLEKQTQIHLESILRIHEESRLQIVLNDMIRKFNNSFERDNLLSMNKINFKPDEASFDKNTFIVTFDFNL